MHFLKVIHNPKHCTDNARKGLTFQIQFNSQQNGLRGTGFNKTLITIKSNHRQCEENKLRSLADSLGLVERRVAREEEWFRGQFGQQISRELVVQELGDTRPAAALFDILDDDDDDLLNFDEFMLIKYLGINNTLTAKLDVIFKMFDTDGVGVLDR